MRRASCVALAAGVAIFAASSFSVAQVHSRPLHGNGGSTANANAVANLPSTALLSHFGTARVDALAAGGDANSHLAAILRAREVATPDSLAAILPTKDHLSFVRGDGRQAVAIVRTLADRAETPEARSALAEIVSIATTPVNRRNSLAGEDAERIELARKMAAMALASTVDPEGPRALLVLLHSGGSVAAAASAALKAYPPIDRAWTQTLPAERANLDLARATFDLRDVGALEALARRTSESDRVDAANATTGAPTKAAARASAKADASAAPSLGTAERILLLDTLGRFDDARVIGPALAVNARKAAEPPLRIAALEARIAVGGTNVADDVAALIADDVTVNDGIRLATTLAGGSSLGSVVHALATRLAVTGDEELRARILAALAHLPANEALDVIVPFVHDTRVAIDAANALARSPLPRALDILTELAKAPATRRLALRAYLVRAVTRGERSAAIDALVATLLDAKNPDDRALARGVATSLADGETTPTATFAALADDADPRVVRAVLLALPRSKRLAAISLHALALADATTRALALANLAAIDPDAIAGDELSNRVRLGDIDAPMAARALVARTRETDDTTLHLLASSDDVVLEQALRGYGESHAPDRAGRLADRYLYEANPERRRVLLDTLVHVLDATGTTPFLRQTLTDAARLDPDAACRAIARGVRFDPDEREGAEAVWLHVQTPSWTAPRAPRPYTGLLLSPESASAPRPVAFDTDGDAVIVRLPSGSSRLRLAPRVTSYEPPSP